MGSPKYRILFGDVLLCSVYYVNLLAISVELFLPISAPIPVKRPPSENPIALSIAPPAIAPPTTSKYDIELVTIGLPTLLKLLPILPRTTGAPNVSD